VGGLKPPTPPRYATAVLHVKGKIFDIVVAIIMHAKGEKQIIQHG